MTGIEVRRAFARAAGSYDKAADFQREAALYLLSGIAPGWQPRQLLDVGCGTGHGSGLLRAHWPGVDALLLDFALPMLIAQGQGRRVCADAERLPLQDACVDFYWSNLTMQWCDAPRFVAEAARVLRPSGRLALSTLGPATFGEVRQAFGAVDGYRHTLDFADEPALRAAFAAAGLRLTRLERVNLTRHFPALQGLLSSVRELGANRVTGGNRRPGLMGKAAWRRFVESYEQMRSEHGLPLSYDTFLIHAEK
ncbi:MAG TPA: methyltransferase domain-containing protein [Rhodocyclaceae bacterium]